MKASKAVKKKGRERPKAQRLYHVHCAGCHENYGAFKKKYLPESFVCPHCKLGQKTQFSLTADYTPGHNATGHRVGW